MRDAFSRQGLRGLLIGLTLITIPFTFYVSNVSVLSPNRASVTFSIIYGGKPVVANQGGWAVKDGTWKVAGTTFCGLVSLSGTTPIACHTVKGTSLPS